MSSQPKRKRPVRVAEYYITARVPLDERRRFDALAEQTGRTRQNLILEAVEVLCAKYGIEEPTPAQSGERA